MHVAVVADLHGFLPEVPACDLLLVGGDLPPFGLFDNDGQVEWLDADFRVWLEQAPADHVVGIAGNHDFVFERAPHLVPDDLRWTYLQDSSCEVAGLTIWGSPWTPWFGGWAFNAPRGEEGEPFLAGRFAAAPDDADVLLVHGPPRGYGDEAARGGSVGSAAQLELVDRVAPRLHVFGHIHEGRGSWERDGTRLVNASAVDLFRELRDDPVVLLDL